MLAERVVEWTRQWKEEGLQEGLQQGARRAWRQSISRALAAERALLLRQTRQRFDAMVAEALAPLLATQDETEALADIGEWIVTCSSGEELLARVRAR